MRSDGFGLLEGGKGLDGYGLSLLLVFVDGDAGVGLVFSVLTVT